MKFCVRLVIFSAFFIFSCNKGDEQKIPSPEKANTKVDFADVPASQQALVKSFVSSYGQQNDANVEFEISNPSSILFGESASGSVLFMSFPVNGKLTFSHEQTATVIAKTFLCPFAQTSSDYQKSIATIKAVGGFSTLVDKISQVVASNQSPIDNNEVMVLAYNVAAEANEKIISARVSADEISKSFFIGGENSLEGQSVWMQQNKTKSELQIFNNSRIAWAFKLQDGTGKVLEDKVIDGSEFADDFGKLTSYLSLLKGENVKYTEIYKAKIYQNDESKRRQVYTLTAAVINMIIEVIPWEVDDKCYQAILETTVGSLLPKLATIGDPVTNPGQYISRVESIINEFITSPSTYEDIFNNLHKCDIINVIPTIETVKFYSRDVAKLMTKVMRAVSIIKWPAKLTKLGFFVYQFINYSASEFTAESKSDAYISFKANGVLYRIEGFRTYPDQSRVALLGVNSENGIFRLYSEITFMPASQYKGVGRYTFMTQWGLSPSQLYWIRHTLGDAAPNTVIASSESMGHSSYNGLFTNVYSPKSGYLDITKDDGKYIEGKFEYTMDSNTLWWTPNMVVTDGQFRCERK